MTYPTWLTTLLAERYPRTPAGIDLLTLSLRPAATCHEVLQREPVPEDGPPAEYLYIGMPTIPPPLYSDRQRPGRRP